jgi:hypothetical protein
MPNIHIALDFDRTLATFDHGDVLRVGEPILPMIEKVKEWLSKNYEITIFTARVSKWMKDGTERNDEFIAQQKVLIQEFLAANGLPAMKITANKDPNFTHFVDDKAVKVTPNQGVIETLTLHL